MVTKSEEWWVDAEPSEIEELKVALTEKEQRIKELEKNNERRSETIRYLDNENRLKKNRIEELERVIKELESTQSKWISVEDRLPEDRQEVLIESVTGVFLSSYLKGYKTFYVPGLCTFTINGVKNWMPLPQPRKARTKW